MSDSEIAFLLRQERRKLELERSVVAQQMRALQVDIDRITQRLREIEAGEQVLADRRY